MQNQGYQGPGADYVPTNYSASIVRDPQTGYAARFEVRSGDVPPFGGSERSEVQADANTGGTEGQTMWYAFSTRFDPSFPQNHADLGWGLTNQWHTADASGSPTVGWYVDQRNGFWSLTIHKQSSPGVYLRVFSIFDVPKIIGAMKSSLQVVRAAGGAPGAGVAGFAALASFLPAVLVAVVASVFVASWARTGAAANRNSAAAQAASLKVMDSCLPCPLTR